MIIKVSLFETSKKQFLLVSSNASLKVLKIRRNELTLLTQARHCLLEYCQYLSIDSYSFLCLACDSVVMFASAHDVKTFSF